MSNLEEQFKNIKIKNTLSKESQMSNWDELEKKYINYNKSSMKSNLNKKKLGARPKWFTSLWFSLAAILVVAFPVSAYFVVPTFQESVNSILKIDEIKRGILKVESSSEDEFSVFINGEYQGETPFSEELPEGNYSLRLSKEGFEEKFISVNIVEDQISRVEENLLSLDADPFQGWLSYRNETLGFGLRYPRDWSISENREDGIYQVQLSYVYPEDSERKLYCELKYEEKNIEAYDEENFVFEDIDYGSAGKGIERKVRNTIVDSLKFACSYNPDYEEDKTLTEKWMNSVGFINQTDNNSDGDVLYDENTSVKAPQSSQGNYVLRSASGDIKIIDTSGEKILDANYSLPNSPYKVDPSGKFVVYTENAVVFAKDLANGRTVELFRGKNEDNIIFDFALKEISSDSKYLVYSLRIRDIAECLNDEGSLIDGLCPGDLVEEMYGWKSGIYVYDLEGELGNMYLPYQPFDFNGFFEGFYTVDWFNDSETFYLFDFENNVIYRYEQTGASFEFAGKLELDGNVNYSNLDMWNDEFGVAKIYNQDYSSFGLYYVSEKEDSLITITELDIDCVMDSTGSISSFKLFELDGQIYFFVNNSVWMYATAGFESTGESWQSFKYLGIPAEGELVYSNVGYYPTDKDDIVISVEHQFVQEGSVNKQETHIQLFDPIAMSNPITFSLSGNYSF